MATKPTDRILDWASGGSTTDPGGSKEAEGWLTSERVPANWWNWILNSFGQWLTYFEATTDEGIAHRLGSSRARVRIISGAGSVEDESGLIVSTGTPNDAGLIAIFFSSPAPDATYIPMVTSSEAGHLWTITGRTVNDFGLHCEDASTGNSIDLTAVDSQFFVYVVGLT
jgi:hypothetical protein